ncbi:MAG: IS4/IS5 family transposase [Bacteroidetes bacterium]|nr:MAG: IS4/IS5 family transposase [Bacteroidota bacterium]
MKKSKQLEKSLQMKFHSFLNKTASDFSKPENRFLREMFFGILCSSHVHASKIGRHIPDKVCLKKTLKRLSYHLHKQDLWLRFLRSYLSHNRDNLSRSDYLVIDIGDITKQYASKMEGLYSVHDGSKGGVGKGYWTIGVVGCQANPHKRERLAIKPLYTELFSYHTAKEDKYISENKKILRAMDEVELGISSSAYWVGDRGFGRRKIIEPCLKKNRHFIFRMDGKLNLWYKGEAHNIRDLSRKVELKLEHRILKKQNNRYYWRIFKMGAVAVQWVNEYTKEPEAEKLWLVVAKEKKRGYSWFLVHSPKQSAAEVIKDVAEGYSARWQIEEVYRHIKTQFHLEEVSYRKYEALKNIMAILWIALTFIYNQVVDLAVDILDSPRYKINHGKLKLADLHRFIYYKLSRVVQLCFLKIGHLKLYEPIIQNKKCINLQLELVF